MFTDLLNWIIQKTKDSYPGVAVAAFRVRNALGVDSGEWSPWDDSIEYTLADAGRCGTN